MQFNVGRRAYWLNGEYLPFWVLSVLIIFPYMLFQESITFPIQRTIGLFQHLVISVPIVIAMLVSFKFAIICSRHFTPSNTVIGSRSWDQKRILTISLFLMSVSFGIHIYQLILVVPAYIDGGFIAARSEFEKPGIGIFLRLYIIALPLYAFSEHNIKRYNKIILLLFVLTILRAFFMSERMAMLEFVISIIVCNSIRGEHLSYKSLLLFSLLIAFVFSLVQFMRFLTQSDIDSKLAETGGEGVFNLLFLYYGDVQNKFYQILFFDVNYPEIAWTSLYRLLEFGRQDYRSFGFFTEMALINPAWVSSLNNPGGLAQDFSDFGLLFGLIALLVKTFFSAFILYAGIKNIYFSPLSVIFYIQLIEYPRFNFIFLPFVQILIIFALILVLILIFQKKEFK